MKEIKPEVLEQWRREFEREIWPHFKMNLPEFNQRNENGSYFYAHMNLAWKAWILSRQTVRIPMPDVISIGKKRCVLESDLIETIESAGYKCEGVGGD